MTKLCEYFFKYKSDKCPQVFHSYSPVYYEILKDNRDNFLNVLEIGIGTNEIMKPISGENYQIGSSLKAWRDFFPNSTIYGLDIVEKVLFEDERIECYYTDQSKESELEKTIKNIKTKKQNPELTFDLIIDDGSHVVDHMILSFNVLKKYLNTDGLYIIEDIKRKDLPIFSKLSDENFEIIKSHDGVFDWDSFIVFKNKKK